MIVVDGREYGRAEEIAGALGPDVTADMVRKWARRNGLATYRVPGAGRGKVYHPLDQAAEIEAAKRHSPRGRPRCLTPSHP